MYVCMYSYFNPTTLTSLVICEKGGAANNGIDIVFAYLGIFIILATDGTPEPLSICII
jgi:hypothetical protein